MVGWCTQLSYDQLHRRYAPVYAYEFAEDSGQVAGDLPLGAPTAMTSRTSLIRISVMPSRAPARPDGKGWRPS
jgi:hypothetical protein